MKVFRTAILLVALAAAPLLPLVLAQNHDLSPQAGAGNTQSALRIVSPAAGQMLNQSFVVVKFELTNPGISGGSPNFRVQLDGRDPVITTFTEYTFTGLRPGEHTLTVDLVDANNNPVPSTRSEIRFNVAQPRPAVAPGQSVAGASKRLQPTGLTSEDDASLPEAGSALPLLSVIGFGALLGGIASALRTR